jgi:hypothetical protein
MLLKIDVQGSELQVLQGRRPALDLIDEVYCECSFVELYEGQALADEVICHLRDRGFGWSAYTTWFTTERNLPASRLPVSSAGPVRAFESRMCHRLVSRLRCWLMIRLVVVQEAYPTGFAG